MATQDHINTWHFGFSYSLVGVALTSLVEVCSRLCFFYGTPQILVYQFYYGGGMRVLAPTQWVPNDKSDKYNFYSLGPSTTLPTHKPVRTNTQTDTLFTSHCSVSGHTQSKPVDYSKGENRPCAPNSDMLAIQYLYKHQITHTYSWISTCASTRTWGLKPQLINQECSRLLKGPAHIV